jgi:hypothetical protein
MRPKKTGTTWERITRLANNWVPNRVSFTTDRKRASSSSAPGGSLDKVVAEFAIQAQYRHHSPPSYAVRHPSQGWTGICRR